VHRDGRSLHGNFSGEVQSSHLAMSPWRGEKRAFSDGGFRRGFRQLTLLSIRQKKPSRHSNDVNNFRIQNFQNFALPPAKRRPFMFRWASQNGADFMVVLRRSISSCRTRVLNSTKTFTKTIVRKLPNQEGVLIPILEMGKYEFYPFFVFTWVCILFLYSCL
jgi:hypothetical protein